jgi:tape measure domain-containing protein
VAAEIDPVVLKFFAENQQFKAELRNTTRTVDQQLGLQEKRVKRLEGEFRRSSGAIGASLKGLAGTLATAFTGRELVGLIDSFTRLQNSLRVAGLEGENLAEVQAKLFDLAAKNGISANSLADLYGKAAQAGRELGASQEQLLTLTENTALALRISGTDAQAASGAILGLTQALTSGTVRMEEFNQVNEGGLRPLLQAAVASGEFGGSVASLRNEILAGKVTSVEFFRAVEQGSAVLREQAANSVLTLSGAMESLNARLVEYVGSNATATGATGLLAGAIQSLAENIDDVIEALSVIAIAIGTRYAAGVAAAVIGTVRLSAGAVALGVALNGVAATARVAGVALAGAFGGPIGLAVGALAIGLTLLAARTTEAEQTALANARGQEAGAKATEKLRKATEALANAHGKSRAEALAAAKAERELTLQKLASARASLQQARGELARAQALNASNLETASRTISGAGGGPDRLAIEGARGGAAVRAAAQRVIERAGELEKIAADVQAATAVINASSAPSVGTVTDTGSTASPSRGGSGRDASEIERRYLDELDANRARIAAAEASMATTAEERAELELRQLEAAQRQTARSLEADTDYSEAQKARVAAQLESVAEAERAAIEFRKQAEIEQRNLELADERGRAAVDALRLQFDLATTEKDRRAIALQILDAEQSLLRERLEAIALSQTANEIDRERARIALAALDAQAGAQREAVNRQFASPLERFAIDAQDSDQRVEEAAVRRIEELNQTVTDAFTNALGVKDPFLSQLIKIFLDKNVFGPLADALSQSGGLGGGGGFLGAVGSVIGGLFGRSSGGFVQAGRPYRVNEGASAGRVEAFVPQSSGQIIPLGRMNAAAAPVGPSAGGTVKLMIEEAPGFAAKVRAEATGVAVEVVRQTAPTIVDAAANETLRRANRPGL